jgi:hypothetical protein
MQPMVHPKRRQNRRGSLDVLPVVLVAPGYPVECYYALYNGELEN